MSEESEGAATGPEGVGAGVDPVATAMALGGASREDAKAFLDDQRALIAKQGRLVELQCDYLTDKDKFELSHLRWRRFTEQMKGALQFLTAVVGIAFAASLSYVVWDAAHSKGLIIEPFTVPAELAARGLNGQAFSSMLLDKLTTLQAQTQSNRPAQSYSNNWGNDLKVEIPTTGVSLGELRRFLREWLGRDTHISGEVWQGAKGLTITARASGGTGEPVTGPESDLDALMQKAALNVYRVTQPYRYANYLDRDVFHPGVTDIPAAEAIYRRLIGEPNPVEQAYAWNGLANLAWTVRGDNEAAIAAYTKANEADPKYTGAAYGIAYLNIFHLSHLEAGLAAAREYARRAVSSNNRNQWLDMSLGDYSAAMTAVRNARQTLGQISARNASVGLWQLALMHDGPGLRDWVRDLPAQPSAQIKYSPATPMFWVRLIADTDLGDWRRVLATEPEVEKLFLANNPGWNVKDMISRSLRPRLALARAKTGDTAGAQSAIAATPGDCDYCVRVRGIIASEQKQWARADFWFAKAVADAPSIPFALEDWGRSMLARGRPDAAIAKFTLANQKGPHFADALEGWGEALMAKNQSHLAQAKFREAEKYAPNWGRLHLKWGQALVYAGKPEEAKKQFARAAQLDLTPSEKSEFARTKS